MPTLAIDHNTPQGNIIVDYIDGDSVFIRPDLRDTQGDWFYWCFRALNAQGRTLTFSFTASNPVGVRGPAVSLDHGLTWRWLGAERATNTSFIYTFPAEAPIVLFSMGMPYTQRNWDGFLQRVGPTPLLQAGILCRSAANRPVETLLVNPTLANPRCRIIITARHHCCEMMASYTIEGIVQAAVADTEAVRFFRQNLQLLIVPFMDKDGVENGDQGKNRRPYDHNRDYMGNSIYRETAALRQLAPQWLAETPGVLFDLHCPWIRGQNNEHIYQVGSIDPVHWQQQQQFGAALESAIQGPLPYQAAKDLPYGKDWNVTTDPSRRSCTRWAGTLPTVRLASSMEIPYANVEGAEVNQTTARLFGHDLARALFLYLRQ